VNKAKILIASLLLSVLITTTGAGCSCTGTDKNKTGEKITLTMWGVFDDESVYKPIIDLYQQLNPNIIVNYVKKDYAEYENETVTALAAGKGPDIWMIRNDWVYQHYDKLKYMPPKLFAKSESDTRSDIQIYENMFPDIVAKDNIINDKIYSIPLSVDTLAVYYNSNQFSKKQQELYSQGKTTEGNLFLYPPNNWDQFLSVAKLLTIKDANGNITRSGAALGTASNIDNCTDILSALMFQNKTNMWSADKLTATFNLPIVKESGEPNYAGTQALNFYTSFADPTKENYMWNDTMPNAVEAFKQGKVSMMITYGSIQKRLAQEAPGLVYKIGPLPQIAGDTSSTDFASYWTYTVTNNSKKPVAAWMFIKYMLEQQDQYTSATGRPSSKRISNLSVPPTKQRAVIGGNPFNYQKMTAVYWYKGVYPNKVDNAFYTMIEDVIVNKQPLQKSIDKAAAVVTELYKLSADNTKSTASPTATSTAKTSATATK